MAALTDPELGLDPEDGQNDEVNSLKDEGGRPRFFGLGGVSALLLFFWVCGCRGRKGLLLLEDADCAVECVKTVV